jgi:hypothetical protein
MATIDQRCKQHWVHNPTLLNGAIMPPNFEGQKLTPNVAKQHWEFSFAVCLDSWFLGYNMIFSACISNTYKIIMTGMCNTNFFLHQNWWFQQCLAILSVIEQVL